MRIAQLAPLWETVPPTSYGGTELVIHLLTEELVRQGHEVTLFAAGACITQAVHEVSHPVPLRQLAKQYTYLHPDSKPSLYPGSAISAYFELQLLNRVFQQADRFDVIHNHLGFITLPFARFVDTPVVTTLHGAFKGQTLQEVVEQQAFEAYAEMPYVSISDEQRRPSPNLNYMATVYHGLDTSRFAPNLTYDDTGYLAFLGRFCYDKGAHIAIHVAKATGHKLVMAGKVDCDEEQVYFREEIAPHLDGERIRYIGELDHPGKVELLRHAKATLCPVTWPEPFGLVLIESMACGTPVIALRNGSIPEVIEDGKTGFVVDTAEELIAKVHQIGQIDRRVCRHRVETRFSAQRVAQEYLSIYRALAEKPARATSDRRRRGKSGGNQSTLETLAVLASPENSTVAHS